MAQFATELFAHFVYSPKLSYHELLDRDEELKIFISRLIEEQNGEYPHFEAMGDALRAQCVFAEYGEDLFHALCDAVAPVMDGDVEARLLFVSKDLDHVHQYTISKKKWQEAVVLLPPGPIGLSLIEENDPQPLTAGKKKG